MIKKWLPFIGGIVLVAGILLFSVQQIFVKTTLTEQEIINRVESLYNGSVEDITKNARHYNVVFSDGTKIYEVIVDEEQGTFLNLSFIADRTGSLTTSNEPNIEQEETDSTHKQEVATNEQEQTAPQPPAINNSTNTEANSNTSAPSSPAPATPPVRISESAAHEIARAQLNGQIEDTDFYSTADGGYYIVEIETEEQEAAFQIHAITGKILSVVYDD